MLTQIKVNKYLPSCARERNSSNESVVKSGNVDPEVVERHALCSALVSQTFDRVQLLQWRITSREHEAEYEDESDDCFGLASPLDEGRSACVCLGLAIGALD
jgi:hypothetical protein